MKYLQQNLYLISFLLMQAWVCLPTCINQNFDRSLVYSDKFPNEPPRLQSAQSSRAECVLYCNEAHVNIGVIFNPSTSSCSCYLRQLSLNTYTAAAGVVAYVNLDLHNDYFESWATSVRAFSSEFTNFGPYPATSILGAPNFYPSYGDTTNAWSPAIRSREWIEVQVAEMTFITEVHIYETYNGGAVESVSLLDADSTWQQVWMSPGVFRIQQSRIFIPVLEFTYFKTDSVRLDVDMASTGVWAEFDAIRIIGTRVRTRSEPV